ncbi:helix-turn-helix domain-containing protein [Paenibacillus sp. YN15]|uniref:helix-turn-helix domain-containing protein n=1 Tax=Paenibacillus sp. YN15 TaxID=1742774 RepID=UPI000DCAF28B|nr:helix-turn-helix transcriptional regulator [Paenibacillus sp. YN15]RAV06609.1 XRE family transcriptional regulator [Paenibacillus sp. YN15]
MRQSKELIPKIIGRILQAERNRQTPKISQEEIAYRCNLDRSFISMVESGKHEPSVSKIFDLCNGLGIKPAVFFRRVAEEYDKLVSDQESLDE